MPRWRLVCRKFMGWFSGKQELWGSGGGLTGSQCRGGIGSGAWMALLKCLASRLRGRAHITPLTPVTRRGLALRGGCLQVTAILREGPIWELPATNTSSSRQRGMRDRLGTGTHLCVLENWTIRKAERQRIDAFKFWCRRTLQSFLCCKEIKPVNPKIDQFWMFIGRTKAEAEAPILWPPDVKNWLVGKTLMLGKIAGQMRRGWQGWDGWMHHRPNWHEFEQTLGDSEGQGSLVHGAAKIRTWLSNWTMNNNNDIVEWFYD